MNLRNVGEMNRGRDLGSDHFPMESTFGLTLNKDDMTSIRRWKLKRANWKKWYNELAHGNCNIGYRPLDVDTLNKEIVDRITKVSEDHIPKSKGIKKYNRSTPWWDNECRVAVKKRNDAKNLLWRHATPDNLTEYRR